MVALRAISGEDGYAELRKDFNVPGTPTVLFLDSSGEEFDRFVGFGRAGATDDELKAEYIQKVKDFVAGVNTLPAILAELDADPDNVGLNFKLAEKFMDRYETDKAIPSFAKVLELDPDNSSGHKTESTYQIALHEARVNRDLEPLKAFIASDPEEKYLESSYSTLASMYLRNKEPENAVATYEEALQKMPENARFMSSFASTIFSNEMEDLYEKGLELNEKAKTLDPDLETASIGNLARYYQNIGEMDKIVSLYEESIAKWPDNSSLRIRFASTINNLKLESQYERGIELLEKHLEENPDAVVYNYTLGLLYQKNGELEKAIQAMKIVAEMYPTRDIYANTLAQFEKELAERK